VISHKVPLLRQTSAYTCWYASALMLSHWYDALNGYHWTTPDWVDAVDAEEDWTSHFLKLNRAYDGKEVCKTLNGWGYKGYAWGLNDPGAVDIYVKVRPVGWIGRINGYQNGQAVSGVTHHTIVVRGYTGSGAGMKLLIKDPATPIGQAYSGQWTEISFADLHRTLPCIAFFYISTN